jgi:aminopeptidase N
VSDAQLDRVAALLSGAAEIDGLVIDTELRWALLLRLVMQGRAGETEIDAELERDDTAAGRRHALTLRAARPTAEAKAEAWHSIVETDELPNAEQGAVLAGFVSYEQRELLAPYTEKYFAAIGDIYRDRSTEIAQSLITGLYPYWATSSATLDRTQTYLHDEDPGFALRRMLLEGRDSLARALRAQARDIAE